MLLLRVKNPCFLLFLLLAANSYSFGLNAIPDSIHIHWDTPKKRIDSIGKEISVLNFESAEYQKSNPSIPSFLFSINGVIANFKITGAVYQAFSSEEQKIIGQSPTPASFEPVITLSYQNGRPISLISIYPYKISSGIIAEKIISFQYTFENSSIPSVTSSPLRKARISKLSAAAGSVLSSDDWYKLSVSKSGIFKIDYNFIKSIGLNPDNIDPRKIKIFGNGGGMLPQRNDAFRYDDLVENAIYVRGESDGIFDNGDYILFYSNGPDSSWKYDSGKAMFIQTQNIYSDQAFYFLTIGTTNGLRIQSQSSIGGATQTITTFDECIFHEVDSYNILKSGRQWYGELFDYTTEHSFSFFTPGITPNTIVKVYSHVMGKSYYATSFNVSLNDQNLGTQSIGAQGTYQYAFKGEDDINIFSINTNLIAGNSLLLKYNFNKGASSLSVGYLNNFIINIQRDLKLYGSETSFRSLASTTQAVSDFIIEDAVSGMMVWDVSDPLHPKDQQYSLSGTQATFGTNTTFIKEFIILNGSNFTVPVFTGKIDNQNLHSINSPDLPDLVIVTAPQFLNAATRLASFRESFDSLNVVVATTEQAYNEFSSGAQDITAIRDFMKMLHDRRTSTDSTRYLLLFGDGSYDYKNRVGGNTNFVPIYEARQSLHPIDSYSSDDYFGFLDNTEGGWLENSSDKPLMEIGIGRLPVKNATEADEVVNKIINYASNLQGQGKWRNKVSFVADDGDGNLHLNDADDLADLVETNYPDFNVNKIFLDAYPQIPGPGGEICPSVKNAITTAVEKGTLILNYTGHGGEIGWTQESILDISQINNWDNFNELPFFITATCEFGRYDEPGITSGAEYTILNSNGGSIAIITSTRPVYSNSNKDLNVAIYNNNIFTPIGGKMPRLGDVIRKTKNNPQSLSNGINNRNYALLGDPSTKLAYPENEIAITKINGNIVSLNDTIKALGTVTIEGEIRNPLGAKISNFNGTVFVTLYDKHSVIQTFGTQSSPVTSFSLLNNLIYEGPATVTSGSFSLTFVVPKDISYQFDKGKISLYARKDNTLSDASGFNKDIFIGGTDTNFVADNLPPQIKLFMNDESFVFGGTTSENSLFLAKLNDDNGINIAGVGIGHEITAILDNSTEVIVLNEFYSAKKDNYKEGKIEYPFKGLSIGNHSIKFKCWDTHNNSSEAYLEFVVAKSEKIALDHVLNYPNPFSTFTTFHFDHNRAGDDLDVMIQVYTISGKLIKTLEGTYHSADAHFSDIVWDGRDDFGDKIGKGVYVYKVNLRSNRDGSNIFKYQKLVILN